MSITVAVDYQNVYRACENKIRLDIVFGEIMKKALAFGQIHEIRLFAPCYQSAAPLKLLNMLQRRFGFEISSCLTLGQGSDLKDTVDFEVLRWIIRNVYPGNDPDTIAFVTGDGDFIVSANEARRKGKEVEFWFIDSNNVSRSIREGEKFREIKASPAVLLSGNNQFLTTLKKMQLEQRLDEADKDRLRLINRMMTEEIDGSAKSETILISEISDKLGINESVADDLIKALMAMDVARIYPAITKTLCVDSSSPLFQWVSNFANQGIGEVL